LLEAARGPQSSDVARLLERRAGFRHLRGSFLPADADYRRALAVYESAAGKESREVGHILTRYGGFQVNTAMDGAETRSLLERALAIREDKYGPDSLAVAETLEGLAETVVLGSYPEAKSLFDRATAIREGAPGGAIDLWIARNHLALSLAAQPNETKSYRKRALKFLSDVERRPESLQKDRVEMMAWLHGQADWTFLFKRPSVGVSKKLWSRRLDHLIGAFGTEHPAVAECRLSLAGVLIDAGEFEEAETTLRSALAIWEAIPDSRRVRAADVLMRLARLATQRREFDEARGFVQRALETREALYGPYQEGVANALVFAAEISRMAGDFGAVMEDYRRVVDIRLKLYEPDNIRVFETLINQSLNLMLMGLDSDAQLALDDALRILEKGPMHRIQGGLLMFTAWMYGEMGQHDRAFELLHRGWELMNPDRDGPDDPEQLISLRLLEGVFYQQMGDSENARRSLEDAFKAIEEAAGPDASGIGKRMMKKAGGMFAEEGDPEKPGFVMRLILRILMRQLIREIPGHMMLIIDHLAEMLLDLGHPAHSKFFQKASLRIYERQHGPNDTATTRTLTGLSRSLWHLGDEKQALGLARRAAEGSLQGLTDALPVLPERVALRVVASRPRPEEVLFSGLIYGKRGQHWLESCWRWSLRHRAMILQDLATRHRTTVQIRTPELKEAWERLTDARRRLSTVWVQTAYGSDAGLAQAMRDEASRAREEAETELAKLSAEFRQLLALREVDLDDVATALPDNAALVEYVDVAVQPPGTFSKTRHYVALILPAGGAETSYADLGPSAAIDGLVRQWRDELTRSLVQSGPSPMDLSRLTEVGSRLREAVWDPVVAGIGDADLVFVVPDGSLHQLNFTALPEGDVAYLLERGPAIHLLSTARDVVRLSSLREEQDLVSGVLILGDPDYDATSRTRIASLASGGNAAQAAYRGERADCSALAGLSWGLLPETRVEAETLGRLFEAKEPVVVLTGAEASEERFKREASGKRILHIASHGFFLQEWCTSADGAGRGDGVAANAGPRPFGENPLLLSGLVLAGANRAGEPETREEDGILTAEELAALDLQGTELVALSACDTGLGTVEAGEGVFGLRRALEIAGARTVLMSLWPVPDKQAREWMVRFYEATLGGSSVIEASRGASLSALESLRKSDIPTHPYLWAGFVAAGDWR
jgi:CHAT domain-containing protein